MKNLFKFLTLAILFGTITTSCSKDDDIADPPIPMGDYENGILVSAEGGPASVSFISNDFLTTENQIFSNVNDEELGVYLQSIGFDDTFAYIVTDNTNTVTVVDRYTFEKETSITTGLETPRYIGFEKGKGYVSNWGDPNNPDDDFIAVVDLSTNSVETTVSVGEGPEQIISNGNKLYISHKGGYGTNDIISVLDTADNSVSEITVNDMPDEMIISDGGQLVVLCEGKPSWTGDETSASITKIDLATNSVAETLTFPEGVHPSYMSHDNGNLYYQSNNEIFVINDTASTLPSASIIDLGTISPYGMAVKGDKLYVTDVKDFTSLSDLLVYDLNSNTKIETFEVGLIASKIYFN